MSEFRIFSIGFISSLLAMVIVRRLVNDQSPITLDELARVAFLMVICGFAAVAVRGRPA